MGTTSSRLSSSRIAVAGYYVSAVRSRRARIAYQQSVEAIPLFIIKLLVAGAVVMWFAWQLAHNRGLPNVLIILASSSSCTRS